MDYLTEESLKEALGEIFPNVPFIYDKTIPGAKIKARPDYRNDELKLIVEYDGDAHYCSAKRIKGDLRNEQVYASMGYKVIRIPYFVQISTETVKHLFNIDRNIKQAFPHGFISKTVVLPADFCELGIKRFKADLEKFHYIKSDIINSLNDKIKEIGDKECVIPSSLDTLIS
jgi:hypothetical protein